MDHRVKPGGDELKKREAAEMCEAHEAGERSIVSDPQFQTAGFFLVTTGHSRSKNGVASLAYDPVVHAEQRLRKTSRQIQSYFISAWIAGLSLQPGRPLRAGPGCPAMTQ